MEVIAVVHADITAPASGIDAHVEAVGIRWIRVSTVALPQPVELARQVLGPRSPDPVASSPAPAPVASSPVPAPVASSPSRTR